MSRWLNWTGYRNVVSLVPKDGTGRPRSILNQVEAYWNALPRDGGVPRRADVDPRGLENLLEYAFVLERVAPGVARFRLAGQHLNLLTGAEVRGMPITALFCAAARPQLAAGLDRLFGAPAVVECPVSGAGTRFGGGLAGHLILLPLRSETGRIDRALGALVTDARPGMSPTRLVCGDASTRPVLAPHRPPVSACPEGPAFAEDQATYRPARQHLRVVHSTD